MRPEGGHASIEHRLRERVNRNGKTRAVDPLLEAVAGNVPMAARRRNRGILVQFRSLAVSEEEWKCLQQPVGIDVNQNGARKTTGLTLLALTPFILSGGAEGSRTPDLLNAIQARSQLRYSPEWLYQYKRCVDMSILFRRTFTSVGRSQPKSANSRYGRLQWVDPNQFRLTRAFLSVYSSTVPSRSGGTGRRAGLKIQYPQGCESSILSSGTIDYKKGRANVARPFFRAFAIHNCAKIKRLYMGMCSTADAGDRTRGRDFRGEGVVRWKHKTV